MATPIRNPLSNWANASPPDASELNSAPMSMEQLLAENARLKALVASQNVATTPVKTNNQPKTPPKTPMRRLSCYQPGPKLSGSSDLTGAALALSQQVGPIEAMWGSGYSPRTAMQYARRVSTPKSSASLPYSQIQTSSGSTASPTPVKAIKAKPNKRTPAKTDLKSTTKVTKSTKKSPPRKAIAASPVARNRQRPIEQLYDAKFATLTQEEKARLLLPLLQGVDPLTGNVCGKPGVYGMMAHISAFNESVKPGSTGSVNSSINDNFDFSFTDSVHSHSNESVNSSFTDNVDSISSQSVSSNVNEVTTSSFNEAVNNNFNDFAMTNFDGFANFSVNETEPSIYNFGLDNIFDESVNSSFTEGINTAYNQAKQTVEAIPQTTTLPSNLDFEQSLQLILSSEYPQGTTDASAMPPTETFQPVHTTNTLTSYENLCNLNPADLDLDIFLSDANTFDTGMNNFLVDLNNLGDSTGLDLGTLHMVQEATTELSNGYAAARQNEALRRSGLH